MAEDFVSRIEFDEFKRNTEKRLDKMDNELETDQELLYKIDKTVDSIATKLSIKDVDDTKIIDLKLAPMEKRVDKLEDQSKWLKRTIGAAVIGIVITIIVAAIKTFAI